MILKLKELVHSDGSCKQFMLRFAVGVG